MVMTRKRRLLIVLGSVLAVLVIAFFSHPYGRQLVLGPKIRGVPFWAWQQQFRKHATRGDDDFTTQALGWIGIKLPEPAWIGTDPDMLPVVLSLADDPDPRVRSEVARWLGVVPRTAEAEETLIHLLDDPEPKVRV